MRQNWEGREVSQWGDVSPVARGGKEVSRLWVGQKFARGGKSIFGTFESNCLRISEFGGGALSLQIWKQINNTS